MRNIWIAVIAIMLVAAALTYADRQYGESHTVTDSVYTVTFEDKAGSPFTAMTLSVWNTDAAGGDTCYLDYTGVDHTDGTVEGGGSTSIVIIPANTIWDHEFNLPGPGTIYIDCTGGNNSAVVYIDASDSRR